MEVPEWSRLCSSPAVMLKKSCKNETNSSTSTLLTSIHSSVELPYCFNLVLKRTQIVTSA